MHLFVDNMLQHKSLMSGAKVRSETSLSGATKVMILNVLDDAVMQNACVELDDVSGLWCQDHGFREGWIVDLQWGRYRIHMRQ